MLKMKRMYLLGAAFIFPLAFTARASNITYHADDTVGTGTVIGTIVTDGKIGTLSSGDFLDWDLVLTDSTGSADLTGPLSGNNSSLAISDSNVTASATLLQFDFNSNGGFMNFFSNVTCSPPEWSFETTGSGTACNGTTGNEEGIASNDPFGQGTYSSESGEVTFASTTSQVPEPATLSILGAGLAAFGLLRRRRGRAGTG